MGDGRDEEEAKAASRVLREQQRQQGRNGKEHVPWCPVMPVMTITHGCGCVGGERGSGRGETELRTSAAIDRPSWGATSRPSMVGRTPEERERERF